MSRVADYIALIDDPEHPPLTERHPLDEALVTLMVFLAFSDGVLADDEVALIGRMRPDLPREGLRDWVLDLADTTFDSAAMAAQITDPVERWGVMRLATRMVCMDGEIAEQELEVLADLAAAFGMDEAAPRRAAREVVADGGPISTERLMSSLRNMLWRNAVPSRDEPEAELAGVAPEGAEHVVTVTQRGVEVAALYREGFAATFQGGPRFLAWTDIRTYTRVPVPGASFHVHTATEHLSMADPRMRDIGMLLDFIYGREVLPDA